MRLSQHFTLQEMIRSATASRAGLANPAPTGESLVALVSLVTAVLQPVRDHFGPVRVTSGYRSPEVNALVGGSATSQHLRGEAADITFIKSRLSLLEAARRIEEGLVIPGLMIPRFDQLILEGWDPVRRTAGWLHISYKRAGNNRNEVLTISNSRQKMAGLPS